MRIIGVDVREWLILGPIVVAFWTLLASGPAICRRAMWREARRERRRGRGAT